VTRRAWRAVLGRVATGSAKSAREQLVGPGLQSRRDGSHGTVSARPLPDVVVSYLACRAYAVARQVGKLLSACAVQVQI
jgi:hypothetical protein